MQVICLVWQVQASVDCTAEGAGRFTDGTDTNCKNYTLCILNPTTNTYVAYDYTCPTTSMFSPDIGQCTTNYVCDVTNTPPSTSVCTTEGWMADPTSFNCSSYISCVDINGVFEETSYTCPDTTFYNPQTTLCEPNYICPTIFNCAAVGRFPNTADTTCQSYYMCVSTAGNTYVQYEYTCPSTSVFSPITTACTTTYPCPQVA